MAGPQHNKEVCQLVYDCLTTHSTKKRGVSQLFNVFKYVMKPVNAKYTIHTLKFNDC